jgi:hypothetical protein
MQNATTPIELCPAPFLGLTVQPCGEPCGSAGGFGLFEDGSYLNGKEITPPSTPEYMPVVSQYHVLWLGGSVFASAGRQQNKN